MFLKKKTKISRFAQACFQSKRSTGRQRKSILKFLSFFRTWKKWRNHSFAFSSGSCRQIRELTRISFVNMTNDQSCSIVSWSILLFAFILRHLHDIFCRRSCVAIEIFWLAVQCSKSFHSRTLSSMWRDSLAIPFVRHACRPFWVPCSCQKWILYPKKDHSYILWLSKMNKICFVKVNQSFLTNYMMKTFSGMRLLVCTVVEKRKAKNIAHVRLQSSVSKKNQNK